MIFSAFDDFEYWSLKSLVCSTCPTFYIKYLNQTECFRRSQKERIHQPETYLRDLLQEIAQQNGPGPYQGLYSLQPAFKKQKTEGESAEGAASLEGAEDLGDAKATPEVKPSVDSDDEQ